MKKRINAFTTKILMALFLITQVALVQGQIVFQEDFDNVGGPTSGGAGTYSFPAGWTKFNVDGLTPNSAVAYVNEAWERREDFAYDDTDSCAFSTSWYTPAGTSNDWMFTPAIAIPANAVLSWNGLAYDGSYPDSYEVRIMTASPTSGNLMTSTLLTTVAPENDAWTARSLSLSAYSGQTVYIGFRNISTDMFVLLIDDVTVEVQVNYDAALYEADTLTEYTLIPMSQVAPLPLGATILNNGAMAMTNVRLKVNVYDGTMTNVYTATSTPVATMAASTMQYFTVPSFTPTAADTYIIEYLTLINEADGDNANDTAYNWVVVTDSTYARDDGSVVGSLGIGAGNGGWLGNQYTINTTTEIRSVTFYVSRGYTGTPMACVVWDMSAGLPNAVVCSTDTLLYPHDTAAVYTINISGGPFTLTPGEYVVTAVEFDSTIQVGLTDAIFTEGKMWVNWPTSPAGGWANNEYFGVPSFNKPFVIRPNLYSCAAITINPSTTNASCATCPDGSATVAPSGGTGTLSILWSTGAVTPTINNLLPGTYDVVITDAMGCTETTTVTVGFTVNVEEAADAEIGIMPNPNNGKFTVNFGREVSEEITFQIFNAIGEEVYRELLPATGITSPSIDMGTVASGQYILRISSADAQSFTRIVVE